jgi:CRISPR-associated protein Cmr2
VGNEALKLSAGIAIAHALEPLDEVRELARQAFKHAKEQPRKDAVSIVVCPHSGAPVEATGAWKAMDQSLADITSAFKKDELSFGFAHELQELLDRTAGGDLDGVLPQMAKAIAGKKKENSRALGLIDSVNDGKEYSDGKEYRKELQKLTNRILVARKIAKAERDAEGDEAVS